MRRIYLKAKDQSDILIDPVDYDKLKDKTIFKRNGYYVSEYVDGKRKFISLANFIMGRELNSLEYYYRQVIPGNNFQRKNIERFDRFIIDNDVCGICYIESKKKYVCLIKVGDKRYKAGYFSSVLESKIAYNKYVIDNNLGKTLLSVEEIGVSDEEYNRIYEALIVNKYRSVKTGQGKNHKSSRKCISQYIGVSRNLANKGANVYWIAVIGIGQKITIKRFPYTPEGELMAAKAYNEVATLVYGPDARLNKIPPMEDVLDMDEWKQRLKNKNILLYDDRELSPET